MNFTIDEIRNSIKDLRLDVEELKSNELISKVLNKFSITGEYEYPFWDNFHKSAMVQDELGWQQILYFQPDKQKILFIEPKKENPLLNSGIQMTW